MAPVVDAQGTIYFGNFGDTFYALNPDGTLKWKYSLNLGGTISLPAALGSDGTIYVGGALGDNAVLFAFGSTSTTVASDNTLLIAAGAGFIIALLAALIYLRRVRK